MTRDQPVANIDLAPTIVAITKATPLRVMDGIDLLPLTRDPTNEIGRDLLFEAFDLGSPELGQSFGIRRGQWVYNNYGNGDEELYDMKTDPYQLHNLLYDPPPLGGADAPSPQLVDLASRLGARLAQLRTCSGAELRPQAAPASSSFRCIASARALTPLIGRTKTSIRLTRPSDRSGGSRCRPARARRPGH